MSDRHEPEIQELMEKLDVSHAEAHEIYWIMYDAEKADKEPELIVKELSTVATRFDKNKSIHLKRPKGQKGMTTPIICGYCGSSYKREVEK